MKKSTVRMITIKNHPIRGNENFNILTYRPMSSKMTLFSVQPLYADS